MKRSIVCTALFALVSCGGSDSASEPEGIRLDIEYASATTLDPLVEQTYGGCVALVSPAHWHASWLGILPRQTLDVDGPEMFRATSWVQGIGRYQMRIEDPNTCGQGGGDGADGTVFRNRIRINGTLLTKKVLTDSGEGPRQGFEFVVQPDGTVSNPD